MALVRDEAGEVAGRRKSSSLTVAVASGIISLASLAKGSSVMLL